MTIGFRQKEGVDVSLLLLHQRQRKLWVWALLEQLARKARRWTCLAQPNSAEVSARARSASRAARLSLYRDRSTKRASRSTWTTNARRIFISRS